jgi:hypothetical protein
MKIKVELEVEIVVEINNCNHYKRIDPVHELILNAVSQLNGTNIKSMYIDEIKIKKLEQ